MIPIITLSNPQVAALFVNYMATKGVQIHSQVEHQQTHLFLAETDTQHASLVEEELKIFLLDPLNPRYQAASWQSNQPQRTDSRYRPTFSIKNMVQQSGPLTVLIVIVCIFVYICQQIFGDFNVMLQLSWPYDDSVKFEAWRYITPAFVHFSILHIGFNLAMWWYLASQTEQKLGTGKLFVIMIVSALVSNWTQSLFSGASFGGLSGVVYALIGYVGFTGLRNPAKGIGVPTGLIVFSIVWLIIGQMGVLADTIANAAHFGGFLIGLLMALWDNRHQSSRKTQ